MRSQNIQNSRKAPERLGVENTEQTTWRIPKQDISDEVLRSKTSGVGKAKRKTRRGKRGGVKRRMQNLKREQKMLESVVGEWIKDVRHKMEAPQSDHAHSRDVTVDVLASDVDEMSISPSDVEPLYDYEHYFPEEINNVIENRVDARAQTGSSHAVQDVYNYHSNSTVALGYGQREVVSGYGNTGYDTEANEYGYNRVEYGYGNGQEYGCGYGNGQEFGCGYGNGQEYGCGYGNGQEYGCRYGNGYSDISSYYRYFD